MSPSRATLAFARDLADRLRGHFVELDDANAIARVVLAGDAQPLHHVDIARVQGSGIETDLLRRDFTINALAVRAGTEDVTDVSGGLTDLAARTVRMNDPAVFIADPLRLLRAVRIAAELRFTIEPMTLAEIARRAASVTAAAAERRRDELARMFALPDAHRGLAMLDDAGLLAPLLPDVAAGRGVAQPPQWHVYDVLEHNMQAVAAVDAMLGEGGGERPWLRDRLWDAFAWRGPELRAYLAGAFTEGRTRASLLKLAALLHDVAKPETRSVDPDGRVRFFGHARRGASIARRIMHDLRFSTAEIAFVGVLVDEHLRPVQLARPGDVPSDRAIYRFGRAAGEALPAVLLLALADAAASRGPQLTSEAWARHVAYMNGLLVRSLEVEGIVSRPALLTGRDLMDALGVPPGPQLGKLLDALREAQAVGDVTDREGALLLARRLARGAPDVER